MLLLPNGCKASELFVYPSNWKTRSADINLTWYIKYRFYDPTFRDGDGRVQPKQVVLKGMNRHTTLNERRRATDHLLSIERAQLLDGYNPIQSTQQVTKQLFPALRKALDRITVTQRTRQGISSVLNQIILSANSLKYGNLLLADVSRKHMRQILDNCYDLNPKFTDNTFNYSRKYLSILFNYLQEIEEIDHNPVKEIKTKQLVHKMRNVITDEELQRVQLHLYMHHYNFWRFMNIFLYSGCRITELMLVEKQSINLTQQKFICTIIKGKYRRQVEKVIADKVLGLWTELYVMPGKYVFSDNLIPGDKTVRPDQIVRRWQDHVKTKLGITADFYSLKHYYSDKLAKYLGLEVASANASHTDTKITSRYYATGELGRVQEQLKKFSI